MPEKDTNIGYWEKVLNEPTASYQELFSVEKKYLKDNIYNGSIVLDIGCGDGRNIQSILESTKNVYGIDSEEKAVLDAKRRFEKDEAVVIMQAVAEKLPFKNENFDIVTCLMILPNLENNKDAVFKEVSRVLKKGGQLILSSFAETSRAERLKMYEIIGLPIEKIVGNKIIFAGDFSGNTSEQFSLGELKSFGEKVGLKMIDDIKIGELAYIVKYQK